MENSDEDIQAAWWKCCDFICSAIDTIIFLALFGAVVLGLCALAAFVMMAIE